MTGPRPIAERLALAAGWLAVTAGAGLRLARFLGDRSLRGDEAALAVNILGRSARSLLGRLDFNQAAPAGFLLLEKGVTALLGDGEPALRLVPLVAGIAALALFLPLARRTLGPWAGVSAVAFFAATWRPIFYAAEVKQYTLDLLVTVTALLLAMPLLEEAPAPRRWWLLGGFGAVAVWLSHPSPFVLAGIGLTLASVHLRRGRRAQAGVASAGPTARRIGAAGRRWAWTAPVRRDLAIGALWLASLALCYEVNLRHVGESAALVAYWGGAFAPFPPTTFAALAWYGRTFLHLLENPVGMTAWPGVIGFALGVAALLWRQPAKGALILAPLAVAFAASAARLYPLADRVALYLVPVFALVVAASIDLLARIAGWRGTLAGCLAFCFVAVPAARASLAMPEEWNRIELRPLAGYLAGRARPGDLVYAYALYEPWLYYARRFDLAGLELRRGNRGPAEAPVRDGELVALRGRPRVWVLVTDLSWPRREDLRPLFEAKLDRLGRRLDERSAPGVTLYLYDLSVAR